MVTELEAFEYRGLVSQLFEKKASVICCSRIPNLRVKLSECNMDRVYVKRWCLINKIEREGSLEGIYKPHGKLLEYSTSSYLSISFKGTPL